MSAAGFSISISAAWVPILLLCGWAADGSMRHSTVAAEASARPAGANADLPAAEDLADQGKLVFDRTPKYAAQYVGNKLACGDCHADSGKAAYAAPMIDLAGLFPMFSKRAGHEITLKDRIDECFVRSENGKPPPPDSPTMLALVAYIDLLSQRQKDGEPFAGRGLVKLPKLKGDPARGEVVYVQAGCVNCHGKAGAGFPPFLPPLWGPGSFNDGAGMDHPESMAAYVYHNMPKNKPGSLMPQQAYDVSAYVLTKPRPKFNQAYKAY